MAPEPRDYTALLAVYRTALLTTRGADGHFHSRPMAMRQQVRGEEIWFAASIDSKKCRDLAHEPQCALTFFDSAGGKPTVSISGTGEVIRDRKLVHELWDPSWHRWFTGPDQRDLALIRVMPEHVERHDPQTGATETLLEAPPRHNALAQGE
jgi:general stress protein 26